MSGESAPTAARKGHPTTTTTGTPLRNYTRWRTTNVGVTADLLGMAATIAVNTENGHTAVHIHGHLTPDEARLIGVRLIEAAALADGARAIRETP